jgi:hypothetical protein
MNRRATSTVTATDPRTAKGPAKATQLAKTVQIDGSALAALTVSRRPAATLFQRGRPGLGTPNAQVGCPKNDADNRVADCHRTPGSTALPNADGRHSSKTRPGKAAK